MMEKIKIAIEKAKLENAQARQLASVQLEPLSEAAAASVAANHTENEIDKIQYKNTIVVRLDQACLEKHRIVSHAKNNQYTNIFDSLRTQVLLKMEENNWRTLAVVSPTPASGKTFVSINLAISIAHQPQKTAILVDLDLRRPKVATYLGLHTEKSMNDYLLGGVPLKDVMVSPSIPRLVVIPTMRPVAKSAEILSSNKVVSLIQELRDRYDSRIVIFDAPPVLNSDDAMVLLPQVDCFLLVIANGMSTKLEIEETMHHLPQEKLLGVVFNKSDSEARPYYY
jgi:protein-tyrosine kinase